MPKPFLLALVVSALSLHAGPTHAAAEFKIVTASERGTYIQFGRDIASLIAAPADIDLEVLPSAGSAENVRRLRYEPGVKLAIVQSDVYQAFVDLARGGNREAGDIIRPLRVIMPLYNEEIYFLVRADSDLTYVHEMRDARINAGELGSGTALTMSTLYRLMFGLALPEDKTTFLSNENALVKLIDDKSVDVVAVVAGQPARLLTEMKPEARQFIKLLQVDPLHPSTRTVQKTYFPATVRAASYPNLLSEDVPSYAVRAFLVTYDYNLAQTKQSLARFARSLCGNFSALRSKGHPKWREVELALPDLGRGWFYYAPTARELRACSLAAAPRDSSRPVRACTQHERILGLCN
jgi:TRAP transporter TAXI family solute receptor